MKIPTWSPYQAFEEFGYISIINGKITTGERYSANIELLKRLLTHQDMEGTWKELFKERRRYPNDSNGDNMMAVMLYDQIELALKQTELALKQTKKQTEKRANEKPCQYQEIAKLARELAEKIKASDSTINASIFEFLPIGFINQVLENDIKPEKAAGYFCVCDVEHDFLHKSTVYNESVAFEGKDGNTYLMPLAGDNVEFFNKFAITPIAPTMADIIKTLAEKSEKIAERESQRPAIVKKSSALDETIFIRALYPYWIGEFQTPLYATFAKVCCIVLNNESIGKVRVIQALKNYDNDNFYSTKRMI